MTIPRELGTFPASSTTPIRSSHSESHARGDAEATWSSLLPLDGGNIYVSLASDVIYGRAPVSDLDQLVKDWRSGGGDQIRVEYEQLLR